MTALDKIPLDLNQLSPLGFSMVIHKLPNIIFFLQTVTWPGISIDPVDYPTPFTAVRLSGDHVKYEPLRVGFKVDNDLTGYSELHKWMRGLGFPQDFSEYAELANADSRNRGAGLGIFSDVSLFVLSNLKNPGLEVVFRDAFPISIGSLDFATTAEDVINITCTAEFTYTLFDISPVPR